MVYSVDAKKSNCLIQAHNVPADSKYDQFSVGFAGASVILYYIKLQFNKIPEIVANMPPNH